MQRPGQRAIAGGDGGEQIGLRRGHHARREGRGVHAVVAHGDEIGVERRHLARVGLAAEHHRQRVGGMARGGIGCDRVVALGALHQRAGDHRKRADDGGLVRQARFGAQPRDRRAKTVDDRQAARDAEQIRQPGEGAFAAAPSAARTAASPIGWPVPPLHSRAVTPSKPVLRARSPTRSPAMISSPRSPSTWLSTVSAAGIAVQADRGLRKLDVHGGSPLSRSKGRASRQIDQS